MTQQEPFPGSEPPRPVRVRIVCERPIDPEAFWRTVTLNPRALDGETAAGVSHGQLMNAYLAILAKGAQADREMLRRAQNWLEVMITLRARLGIPMAAKLLAAMPPELLATDCARLTTIFNSRILGMVWRVTPDLDVRPLPPRVPRFGDEAGFGLIRSVPELYVKLAMLSPEMEEIVSRLAAEALSHNISLPPELAAMAQPPAA